MSILLVLAGSFAFGQQPARYHNLALEGGGIRGIAYGGALKELEAQHILPDIKCVAGTSAGAIQAAMLAVGYTPDEITAITFKTPIQQFNDGKFIFFGGANRLFKQYRWYRGDKVTNWIGTLLKEKTGKADITFAELHQLTSKNNFRDLYVTGTNLTDQRLMVFSYETSPDMQVKHAVRISISVPLYYRAVLLDQEGHVVTKPKKEQDVDVLVDGGVLANFPLDVFDQERYLIGRPPAATDYDSASRFYNPQTLGLRLERQEQITYNTKQPGLAPYKIEKFGDYMGAFYNVVKETLSGQRLAPQDVARTISVSTAGFSPRVRKLTEAEKTALLASGRKGVQAFIGNR